MKNILIFLFAAVTIVSCKKQTGVELPDTIRLLTSIEDVRQERENSVQYLYNLENQLILVEDSEDTGKKFELLYKADRLAEVKTFQKEGNQLIFRDELRYNDKGQLQKTLRYSINGRDTIALEHTNEYIYNSKGLLLERRTLRVNGNLPVRVQKYFWSKGNIVRIEHHDGNENLQFEFTYQYDDNINYQQYQTFKVNQFEVWNRNNTISFELTKDLTGLIDMLCNPCLTDYRYDKFGFPTEIRFNGKLTQKLFYN